MVVPAALHEAILIVILRVARSITGGAVRASELAFAHPAPAPAAEYERRLGVPVRFDATRRRSARGATRRSPPCALEVAGHREVERARPLVGAIVESDRREPPSAQSAGVMREIVAPCLAAIAA